MSNHGLDAINSASSAVCVLRGLVVGGNGPLLNPCRHTSELGSQVDTVSIGKNQYRPETVSQLMTQPLTSVSDLTAPVDSHHELRKISDVANESQRQVAGTPSPATRGSVVTVVQLSGGNSSQPEAL
ncbi:hypothetical protein AB0F95_30920 [Micromonospora tulbaghiae]|uniref:hypothetical protein n=1 Tax=Micromonospora tulbaghiae TaxID=479978 RepID=UPI0033CA84EC